MSFESALKDADESIMPGFTAIALSAVPGILAAAKRLTVMSLARDSHPVSPAKPPLQTPPAFCTVLLRVL